MSIDYLIDLEREIDNGKTIYATPGTGRNQWTSGLPPHRETPALRSESGSRGEAVIRWSTVETKEAAEMMRDVRRGPSPYFAMQVEETIEPAVSA